MASSVTCPKCSAVLASQGLTAGQTVQCPYCQNQFALPAESLITQTSGKAIASLVLGLASLVGTCLTGIPAIVCGALALRDIGRQASGLTGRGLAIAGIITGTLFGLLCGPALVLIVGSGYWLSRSFSQNPAKIAAVASQIGRYQVPPGVEPIGAVDISMFGFKMVMYGDKANNPSSMIMLMQFPPAMSGNQQQMEIQMRQQMQMQGFQGGIRIGHTKQLTYTVRGEEVQVNENVGTDAETGDRVRQYIAMLPSERGPIMVMVFTHDQTSDEAEPPSDEMAEKPVSLTEEQVRDFFESFE